MAATRNPTDIPFSSTSVWNIGIGSNAQWSSSSDVDATQLHGLNGGVTTANWGQPIYFGTASVGTVVDIAVGVNVIVAAVLGGRRTVLGAALGAIFLIVAGEFLRPTGELATFIVSAVALLVVLFFPGGFLGAALSNEARQ